MTHKTFDDIFLQKNARTASVACINAVQIAILYILADRQKAGKFDAIFVLVSKFAT